MSKQVIIDKLLDCYPRWSPTMYKLTLGTLVVLAIALPLGMVALPFVEFFNGMAAQPKGKAQATYGRTYGGDWIVERCPVEGTIPRNHYPYPYEHVNNTIEAAGEVGTHLENPLPMTMANLQRGQRLYSVYCITCHGNQGQGDGPVIGPGRFPAPPSLHTKQALDYKDGTLYHIMTKGLGKMPAYTDKLDPEERWMVAHYLRALQRSMAPKPEDLKP
ncbi:MAG: cytochrome c [Phycisphaerales bacterium]|nr:MAG: cytochrome c [Phycisphaerales bacterium]